MSVKLDTLQRKADYWAAKLGVGPVRVDWLDRCPAAIPESRWARGESRAFDAHCHREGPSQGLICVAAHVSRWPAQFWRKHWQRDMSRLMRHEVAHLVGKGNHGTREFAGAAGERIAAVEFTMPNGRKVLHPARGIYRELATARIRTIVEIRRTA